MNNQKAENPHLFVVNVSEGVNAKNTEKSSGLKASIQINVQNAPVSSLMCRTCATNSEFVIPIFNGEGLQNNLADKIHQHLPIQVSKEDTLPLVMCYQCASTLLAWHELLLVCKKADKTLREMKTNMNLDKPSTSVQNSSRDNVKIENELQIIDFRSKAKQLLDRYLRLHYNVEDDIDYYCQKCDQFSKSSDDLLRHLEKHQSELQSVKQINTFITENIAFVESLDDEAEECKELVLASECCPYCESIFSTKTQLLCHFSTHSEVDLSDGYKCTLCNINFANKAQFFDHLQELHARRHVGENTCRSCSAVCDSSQELMLHVKEHVLPNRMNRCLSIMPGSNTTKKTTRVTCPICNKTFSNSYNLAAHQRIHSDEISLFACGICPKVYKSRASLNYHVKVFHNGILNFICEWCGEAFSTRISRDSHQRLHTGEKPYKCDYCNKSFRAKNNLQKHIFAHRDIRNHVCTICEKRFKKKTHLNYHLRTHEKAKKATSKASMVVAISQERSVVRADTFSGAGTLVIRPSNHGNPENVPTQSCRMIQYKQA